MRKAVEYLEGLFEEPYNLDGNSIESDFLNIIKQAQLEAVEETVKLCAEKAEVADDILWRNVDKESILNCAEILKKEIE